MTTITRSVEHHIHATAPCFWVKATQSIQGRKRLIAPGDCLLIDPREKPEVGRLVLVGDRLVQWEGQDHAGCVTGSFVPEGVAVRVSSDFA